MAMVSYTQVEQVAIVTLDSDENRFNPIFLDAFLGTLDAVESQSDARTLVVRSAHEKIFSNGIDLEWLVPVLQRGDLETAQAFFHRLNALFKRLLTYPLLTIAAINGHAFAGGAILCCAFDFRFMRSDRGFFCFPEVDLGIPFLPGMLALLRKAMPMHMVEEMTYTGIRLTAEECAEHHIVRQACHLNTLMDETLAFAKGLKKDRRIIAEMKRRMNQAIVRTMEVDDLPHIASGEYHTF